MVGRSALKRRAITWILNGAHKSMLAVPSALSMIAAILYCGVAAAAVLAQSRAVIQRQVYWHGWAWALIAGLFVLLAVMRVMGVEEWLRGDLRDVLYEKNFYESRRALQGPLFAILTLVSATSFAFLVYLIRKGVEGRRNVAVLIAFGCAGGMLVLMSLRIVSLHSVDVLLYGSLLGPLKLNWLLDGALSLAIFACSVRYRSVVQRR